MLKKLLLAALVVITIIGLPLTVYFSQQKQKTQSHASGAATLYIQPSTSSVSPITKQVGDTVSLDIMVDPGPHAVSFIKLLIHFDPKKFQKATETPFIADQTIFPAIMEGPIDNPTTGDIAVILTVGADKTKAVQGAPARVGTLTLKAIQATGNELTTVSFGEESIIYSVGTIDELSQNVLSSRIPAYLSINEEPTITLPSPTSSPTPTIPPLPSANPSPSSTPTTAPTIAPTTTSLDLTIFLHSIGNSGDNTNPASSLSNKSPLHPNRPTTVSLYNDQNALIIAKEVTMNYKPATGNFDSTVDLGPNFPAGNYTVKIKTDSFLQRNVGGFVNLTPLTQKTLSPVTLVAGDANNDNQLNILDYNILVGCYSDLLPPISCNTTKKALTDFNDDGNVNQIDYNLFLREITVKIGD